MITCIMVDYATFFIQIIYSNANICIFLCLSTHFIPNNNNYDQLIPWIKTIIVIISGERVTSRISYVNITVLHTAAIQNISQGRQH